MGENEHPKVAAVTPTSTAALWIHQLLTSSHGLQPHLGSVNKLQSVEKLSSNDNGSTFGINEEIKVSGK